MVKRRHILTAGAALGAFGFAPRAFAQSALPASSSPAGALTFYAEIRVAEPENAALLESIQAQAQELQAAEGFLSLSLKQMTGDSTMVKNYPEAYKGMLANAYVDAVAAHSLPYFYSLFVRFADYDTLQAARVDRWFEAVVAPHLHAYAMTPDGPQKNTHAVGNLSRAVPDSRGGRSHGYISPTRRRSDFSAPSGGLA